MDFSLNNSRNENLLNSSFKKKKKKKESISKQDIRILCFYEFKNSNPSLIPTILLYSRKE